MTIRQLIHAVGWDAMGCYGLFIDLFDKEFTEDSQADLYNYTRFIIDMSYRFEGGKW